MRILFVLLSTVLAGALAPDAHADTVVAQLPNESAISASGDLAVVSVYGPDDRYRLTRVHADGRLEPLPGIAPRAEPFDADVGTDGRGRPTIVYSRCARPRTYRDVSPVGCDVWLYQPGRAVESKIAVAGTPAMSEFEPTLSRGRLAWASARRGSVAVVTRQLVGRGAARGLRSFAGRNDVEHLELEGRRLAMAVRSDVGQSPTAISLRLIDDVTARRPRARVLARHSSGEGGQTFVGPSFAGGRLGWLLACFGDPGGCRRGPSTYDLRTRKLTVEPAYRPRAGYALMPGGTLEVGGGGLELGDEPDVEEPDLPGPCDERPGDAGSCPVIRRPR